MNSRAYLRVLHSGKRAIASRRNVHIEAKIAALGLEMPAPAVPKGTFVNYLVVGNLAYLSGHLPQVMTLVYILHHIR
jgi:uncharacterized protein involved in high-affinity Fe2+ transport